MLSLRQRAQTYNIITFFCRKDRSLDQFFTISILLHLVDSFLSFKPAILNLYPNDTQLMSDIRSVGHQAPCSNEVWNIGEISDFNATMENQINSACKFGYLNSYNITEIRKQSPTNMSLATGSCIYVGLDAIPS